MKQLATVLACSPRLQTLWLQENAFYYDKDQELPKVHLPCLRALALVALNISILPSLLRILSVGTHELYMRLEFYSDKESLFAARAFLERSRVASLYLSYRANDVMDDPSILPYLHIIYLNLRSDCVARLCSLVILTEEGSFIPRCTTARSLYFLDGNFSEAAQEQIVLVTRCYPLTEIHFLHCGFQLESDSVAWRHADDPVGQDLYDCLVRQVAKVTILYPNRPNTGWDPVLERETIS
ncbi:hypothetical protein FS749_004095 [Ceratobasidium sp. UAMH 11750]|nr:hypothetical protein FS749_004095 [Ceratobasidium sp. UAMH 11750]